MYITETTWLDYDSFILNKAMKLAQWTTQTKKKSPYMIL